MMKKGSLLFAYIYILTSLTACGVRQEIEEETIELLEPVGVSYVTEAAAYRNLYDADVYDSTVLPYIEEYAFVNSGEVEEFAVYPGGTVAVGDVLVYCNTDEVDEQIEALEEKIADSDEDHRRYVEKVTKELEEPKGEVKRLEEIVEDLEDAEPEQYITDISGNDIVNPDYSQWEQQYNHFEGEFRITQHQINVKETTLRQQTELYELDRSYDVENLNALKEERQKYILHSEMAGEVVAIGQTEYGIYKPKAEESVIAVGDTNRKMLKCNYIKKSAINKAEEIYAVINGEKYEVEYQPIDNKEYIRLTANGETVYTNFKIVSDAAAVQMGDYAVVTIINQKRENVLTVPADAISREGAIQYVYVVTNGQSERRDVQTGMSDGVYTEILSGITEGEAVMVQNPLTCGKEEVIVETGKSSSFAFKTGYMYYPALTDVTNPITYGTAYYVDNVASVYQYVEKGDPIAVIRVEEDTIALQRKELKLQRLEERLQDVLEEQDPEKNKYTILDKLAEIEELKQQIAEMKRDGSTTQITAPVSGIIVELPYFEEGVSLKKEALVAQIADANTCYVMVEDLKHQLQYGNEISITYGAKESQECTVTGVVANMSPMAVSGALQGDNSYILVSPEDCSAMLAASKRADNYVYASYRVSAEINKMDNVLLVPQEAVTELAGRTYVHVVDTNGEVKVQSFIAGGFDLDNYWVIEGLSEGMKLCLE